MKSYVLIGLVVLCFAVVSSDAKTIGVLASDWGYVQADYPDTSTLKHEGLYWIGMTGTGPWRLFLKFELPAEIDDSSNIVSVVYKQQSTAIDSGMDGKITYVADDSWTSESLTWNSKPAVSGTAYYVDVVAGWSSWDTSGEINGIFSENGGQTVTLEYKAASESQYYYNQVAFDETTLELPKLIIEYTPYLVSDINKDGITDINDLLYMVQDWLKCNDPLNPVECVQQP